MVPPKLGLGQMALEDNIGVLQEAPMGERPASRGSMAKPLGLTRYYL